MAGIKYNHNMFTVGMISKKIQGNTESESYNNSLLECKNFYIRQTGGVFKRPGSVYVNLVKDSLRMKIYPYNFPDNNSIIIGIIPGEIFAYNLDGVITNCTASDLTYSVINESNFIVLQNANSLYVFCSVGIFEINYNPEDSSITFGTKNFTFSPVCRVNDTSTNYAVYKSSTDTVTLTGTLTFKNSDIGQRCLLFWEDGTGTTTATKINNYSYFTISSLVSETIANVIWSSEYSSYESQSNVPTASTYHFSLPAFGSDRGYPIAAGILSNRLFLADNDLMIYGSSIKFDDIFDFTLGSDENSAISYRMNNDVGKINWIVGQDKLFVGSPTGIYISGGSGVYENEKITAYNMSLKKFSSVHASTLPPTLINANIVFADALSKNIYEISVDETTGTYKTYDLSMLSNELLNSTVIDQTWSSYPVKTYWAVCENGSLVSMTYEKANDVMAWSYHELGGTNVAVESISSIQVDGYDYVFLIVRRNVSGEIVRYVEYLDRLFEPLDEKEYQQHYVDSGLVRKYEYQINNISQYEPPQINDISESDYNTLLQNENANVQYLELCILDKHSTKGYYDIYSDNVWRIYLIHAIPVNYVSFCHIKEELKSLYVDGKVEKKYSKIPIDNNEFSDLSDIYFGMFTTVMTGVGYASGTIYFYCNVTGFSVAEEIIIRNTGILSTTGESLDSTEDKYIRFKISAISPTGYEGSISVTCLDTTVSGINTESFDKEKYRQIYRLSTKDTVLEKGANAIVTQSLDLATAIAVATIPSSTTQPTSGTCTGVVFNTQGYYISQKEKIYSVTSDFSSWTAVTTARSNVLALISQNEYCTTATYVNGTSIVPLRGKLNKYIGKIDTVSYFIINNYISSYDGEYVRQHDSRENITGAVLCADSVQFFGAEGLFGLYIAHGGESNIGTLPNEDRLVRAGITVNDHVFICGDEGLLYYRTSSDVMNWTAIDTSHSSNFIGIVEHNGGILLVSAVGELIFVDIESLTSAYQTVSISSNINGVYTANDTVFLALEDGSVLRSITNSDYTLTFFDLSSIYIDDVVGMEGVNGSKYLIKNIDTTDISNGSFKYELWNGTVPVDTRDMGVYDETTAENGVAHLYFNKVAGLGHLTDQAITICLDGNFLTETTVSPAGTIEFGSDIFGMECHVGYVYKGIADLMPLSGGNMRGSSVGSVGSQKSAWVRLYYSLGGAYGTESDNLFKIIYPTSTSTNTFDRRKALYNGVIELPLINSKDVTERKFRIEHSDPVSFNVLSITQDAEISDA